MNTTYDSKFRFRALLTGVGETLHQWDRSEPTLGAVSNAIKSWQNDWGVLSTIMSRQNGSISPRSQDVDMALDEAWANRANRQLAVKSLKDAYSLMKEVESSRERNTFVPTYRKRSVKAMFGENAGQLRRPRNNFEVNSKAVKSWVNEARDQLASIQDVPRHSRQHIGYAPNAEGHLYARHATRAKMWVNDSYRAIQDQVTPESRVAVKAVVDKLSSVERLGQVGLLDNGGRRAIHSQLRAAFKALDNIDAETRTPVVKTDLFQDMNYIRGRVDTLMPLLENQRYDESDLYRDVTEVIDKARNVSRVAPIKFMPMDTWDNFTNLDRSLTQVLMNRNPAVRVKALRAAAANLDIISKDLAKLEGRSVPRRAGHNLF